MKFNHIFLCVALSAALMGSFLHLAMIFWPKIRTLS